MRRFAAVLCASLGACSWSGPSDIPTGYVPPTPPPDPTVVIAVARNAAVVRKLVGVVEIAPIRVAYPLAPGVYISCIRGANSLNGNRQTYAIFFKGGETPEALNSILADGGLISMTRMSVVYDDCERQTYVPLT